jgi:CRP/FNR family transcriptional regulator
VRLARGFAPEAVEERGGIGDASAVLDPMDVAVQLRSVPAFGRLSTRQLVSLAEVLESIPCASGAAVYSEGDEGDGLYFVLEGEVELLHAGEPIERVGPGGFFGELSTLDGVPRQESAHVRDTARLLRLEREELLAMMEEAPELGIGLCQFLSLRVRALREGGAPARASRPGPSP